jgi:hypothetical protein
MAKIWLFLNNSQETASFFAGTASISQRTASV